MKFFSLLKNYGVARGLHIVISHFSWFLQKRIFHRRLMLKTIQGNKMYLDLQHDGISKTLATMGIREAGHTELIKGELREGMVVVDIGANIGYYTLIAASIVGKNGKVIAIEPDPRNFELLKKNVEKNGYSEFVETHLMAISDRTGTSEFFLSNATNLSTVFDPKRFNASSKSHTGKIIKTRTMKLDDLVKGRVSVDFIRMDIEGYEVEAFHGMMETLRHSSSALKVLFEVHPNTYSHDHDLRPVMHEVMGLGYKAKVVISAGQPRPKQFADLGYGPTKIIRDGQYLRGFYYGVSEEHAIQLACSKPKCVRYVLLEKL